MLSQSFKRKEKKKSKVLNITAHAAGLHLVDIFDLTVAPELE